MKKILEKRLPSIQPPNRPELRASLRELVLFQVVLHGGGTQIRGTTENMSLGGLRFLCQKHLQLGIPMALEFSFGETCYLNLVGQVTYCLAEKIRDQPTYVVGIKFSGIRALEAKILASAIEELKQNAATQEKSFVRIVVSEDSLASEAANLFVKSEPPILGPLDALSNDTCSLAPTRYEEGFSLIGLPTFKLLVDGEDVDTYKYRYFPYAEKLITDYKTVAQVLKQLRMGEIPPGHKEYIFARYCVGGTETNIRAMEAAHRASQEFRYFPMSKRLQILKDIYELLLAHKDRRWPLLSEAQPAPDSP